MSLFRKIKEAILRPQTETFVSGNPIATIQDGEAAVVAEARELHDQARAKADAIRVKNAGSKLTQVKADQPEASTISHVELPHDLPANIRRQILTGNYTAQEIKSYLKRYYRRA